MHTTARQRPHLSCHRPWPQSPSHPRQPRSREWGSHSLQHEVHVEWRHRVCHAWNRARRTPEANWLCTASLEATTAYHAHHLPGCTPSKRARTRVSRLAPVGQRAVSCEELASAPPLRHHSRLRWESCLFGRGRSLSSRLLQSGSLRGRGRSFGGTVLWHGSLRSCGRSLHWRCLRGCSGGLHWRRLGGGSLRGGCGSFDRRWRG